MSCPGTERTRGGDGSGLAATGDGTVVEVNPWAAPFCCSSTLTPSGFHAMLCPTGPPSAFKVSVIFCAIFAPKKASCSYSGVAVPSGFWVSCFHCTSEGPRDRP